MKSGVVNNELHCLEYRYRLEMHKIRKLKHVLKIVNLHGVVSSMSVGNNASVCLGDSLDVYGVTVASNVYCQIRHHGSTHQRRALR